MAASSRNKKTKLIPLIAENRRVTHDFLLYEGFQAGLVLLGWEVKAIRNRQVHLKEAHIHFYGKEAFLVGAHFTPPKETCTHSVIQPKRNRKLLLSQKELRFLREKTQRAGYTVIVRQLLWKGPWVKCAIHLAKGKKLQDVRSSETMRDWERERSRLIKNYIAK